MRVAAVFPKIDALPGAEQQFAILYRDAERTAGDDVAAMRSHVVDAFVIVPIGRVAVGRPTSGQRFEIVPYRWIGVLGQDHRTTRVQHKNVGETGRDAGGTDDCGHLTRDFAGAAAARRYVENLLVAHDAALRSGFAGTAEATVTARAGVEFIDDVERDLQHRHDDELREPVERVQGETL